MNKLKIVFIGGLTNGKIVYDYLNNNRFVDLCLVVTYPDTIEKPRMVFFPEKDHIVKSLNPDDFMESIRNLDPDYIFVAGWSELLPDELIAIPSNGTIGFHPSKLPKDRGRSVLAWQIEEGYSETALTMFYYADVPDSGDILAQEPIQIMFNDKINDILDKLDKATYSIMRAYFPLIRQNKAPRIKQNNDEATIRRLRNERDSLIDWDKNSTEIYNKIRAISSPYPGAHILYKSIPAKIFQAKYINGEYWSNHSDNVPGTVVAKLISNFYVVKTRDGFIQVTIEIEIAPGFVL
jgi:methionyl-tRNA formyltransferase